MYQFAKMASGLRTLSLRFPGSLCDRHWGTHTYLQQCKCFKPL